MSRRWAALAGERSQPIIAKHRTSTEQTSANQGTDRTPPPHYSSARMIYSNSVIEKIPLFECTSIRIFKNSRSSSVSEFKYSEKLQLSSTNTRNPWPFETIQIFETITRAQLEPTSRCCPPSRLEPTNSLLRMRHTFCFDRISWKQFELRLGRGQWLATTSRRKSQ